MWADIAAGAFVCVCGYVGWFYNGTALRAALMVYASGFVCLVVAVISEGNLCG